MTQTIRARWRRVTAAGLVSAALLAGCGGDDTTDSSVSASPAAPSPEQPVAPISPPPPAPATLGTATDVGGPLPAAQLDAAIAATTAAGLTGAARCDVQMVEIVYSTTAPNGVTPTQASGVAMVPGGASCPGPYPLIAYSRGTDLDKARSLATPGDEEATLVAATLAAQGFMVAATDYLGYAKSSWPDHAYLHASSEATANVDALRAARDLAAQRGIGLNGKVFVTGYSQGGHASMATQQLIETGLGAEFSLAGAAHLSGPYNLIGSVHAALAALPLGDLGSTYYIPFAVTSLQKVYRDLYTAPEQFFKAPYAATIEGLFPTTSGATLAELISADRLPLLLSSLITDEFAVAALNPATPLHRALTLNSTTGFTPRAPTLLCGGSRDPVVSFANTTAALQAFQGAGAASVRVFDVEAEPAYEPLLRDDLLPVSINAGYHASLVPPLCLLQARNLFLTL